MWDQSVLGPRPVNRAYLVLHDALRMVARAGFGFLSCHKLLASPGTRDLEASKVFLTEAAGSLNIFSIESHAPS